MDNDRIIIILLVIIAVMIASMLIVFNPFSARTEATVSITSNAELHDGDAFSIALADVNGNPISNQTVNVKFGDLAPQSVTTDSAGNGMLVVNGLAPGQYQVSVEYGGNSNYSSASASQSVTLSEAMTTSVEQSQSSQSPQTITLELKNYDEYVSASSGEYRAEAMKWQGSTVGGFGVWLYKNGQQMPIDSYSSRAYFYMNGEWKWSQWDNGESGSNSYHKYPVSTGVQIDRVEVRF